MEIKIMQAESADCISIHRLQVEAFQDLLEKYNDPDINPGAESIENIYEKFNRPNNIYYKILSNNEMIGAIRVIISEEDREARISPIFIATNFEGKGVCQKAILELEKLQSGIRKWKLDTILEEQKLNHLYEKLGYKKTGRIEEVKENMHIVSYEKLVCGD